MTDLATAHLSSDDDGIGPIARLAPIAHLVCSTVIDGVPVLYAHREGPVNAGLMFRVGWGDESLPRAGITHLIEHLALFGLNLADAHHNGATAETWTHFHATGTLEEVVSYLNDVCAALRALPLERMQVEKEILRTESSRRSFGSIERQRIERYGAQGPGLAGFDSFGLAAVTTDDVQEWAREYFTRDNAVLWITSSTAPDGLRLELPSGERRATPAWHEVDGEKPRYFVGTPGAVLVDAVVDRSTAAMLFARVASKALLRALRQEDGNSYTAQCEYEPIGADRARIVVFADALPDKQGAVAGGVVDVLASLRAGIVDPADLAAAKEAVRQNLELPSLGAAMLPSIAHDLLVGAPILGIAELEAQREAVTPADIARVAESVWADAIVQIADGSLDWAGFTATPLSSEVEVSGRSHPRFGEAESALVIGADGVTKRFRDGRSTVRFDECVALETWPDGARQLVGADGFVVLIEPTLHANITPAVIASIDAGVPVARHVPRPARAPQDIPRRPGVTADGRVAPRWKWRGLGLWSYFVGVFGMILGLAGFMGAGEVIAEEGMTSTNVAGLAVVVLIVLGAGFLIVAAFQRGRWRKYDAGRALPPL